MGRSAGVARIESARLSRLHAEIGVWKLAADTRDYVAALRSRFDELSDADRERVRAWCDWADEWSSHADPVLAPARIAPPPTLPELERLRRYALGLRSICNEPEETLRLSFASSTP